MTRFTERDHPRWPPGTPPPRRGGQFRDKNGGDWADRLGDALPAGRYGSIATGATAQCPICGRTVKLVGTSGKLSTHNQSPGVRCGGSGQVIGDEAKKAGGVVARRAAKKPKNPEIKAPEPPKVRIGPPRASVVDLQARARLQRWREGTRQPGRIKGQNEKTRREWEIENVQNEIKGKLGPDLEYAQQQARRGLTDDIRRAGEDPDDLQVREDWGWNSRVKWETRHEQMALDQALDYLDALRHRKPIPDQQGVRMGIGGYPRKEWTPDELELVVSAGEITLPRTYDPAHPLDVYGDMLHIDDDTWHTYQALDTLEQAIPPVFHEVVAAHLAGSRTYQLKEIGGIWVSATTPLPDLDELGYLRGKKPRGWHKGATWNEVDGVVSAGHTLAVGYSPNTESHRGHYSRVYGTQSATAIDQGNPLAGTQIDASAMGHEFGHLLDYTLGGGKTTSGARAQQASDERLWRLVHGRVVREAGRYLNPYFRQKGDAGPSELFADAFGVWARGSDAPKLYPSTHPASVAGTPTLWPNPKGKPGMRVVTWRVEALAAAYDVNYDVAFEIDDYFDRLLREVKSGKRKTRLQTRGF